MSSSKSRFASAIVELRSTFDENQQRFSDRLGVALATLARWEISDRYPSPRHIKEMWHLANEQEQPKLAKIFADEFAIRAGYAISSGEAGFKIRRLLSDLLAESSALIPEKEKLTPEGQRHLSNALRISHELRGEVRELDIEPPTRALPIKIERKK